jgi:hypothetical protein
MRLVQCVLELLQGNPAENFLGDVPCPAGGDPVARRYYSTYVFYHSVYELRKAELLSYF